MSQQLGGDYEGVDLSSLICDEVQDFTLATVVLLLNLLENEDEFMCGGDTAQTICKVTFNFKDLSEALYRRRERAAIRLEGHWAAPPENRETRGGETRAVGAVETGHGEQTQALRGGAASGRGGTVRG